MKSLWKYLKREGLYVKDKLKGIVANERVGVKLKETKKLIEKELVINKKLSPVKEYEFPIVFDDNFSKYLQKFMHSYRNKNNSLININNLMFLSGPEKIGKSWFLRYNMKSFLESDPEQKHFPIHYDIREINDQNFNAFVFNFEKTVIDSIIEKNQFERTKGRKDIISINEISQVLFFRCEKPLIELYISRALHRAIQNSAFTFSISLEFFDEVNTMLEEYENKGYNSTPLINEHFTKILEMISKSNEVDTLNAYLLLIQDVLIQKENTEKDIIYDNELYRTGIEMLEFLLDTLNFIGGYHELQDSINNDLFLSKNFYPHVVLALESVQNFWEMKDVENRALNFMDTIILRLYNNEGYRNHIPIIFETNKNQFFDSDIYQHLFDSKYTFPSLVYLPIQFHRDMETYLGKIFNNYQLNILKIFLKDSSVYYYKLIFESLKNAEKIDFESIISFSEVNASKEAMRFGYKINRLYLNPHMSRYLDNGLIDYEIIEFIKQLFCLQEKNYIPSIKIRTEEYDYEFLRRDTTRAFFEENITFFHKYNKLVTLQHFIFNHFIRNIYPVILNKKLRPYHSKYFYFFFYFSPFKAFKFHLNYNALGAKRYFTRFSRSPEEFEFTQFVHGFDLRWDIPMELYKGNVTYPASIGGQFRTYTMY